MTQEDLEKKKVADALNAIKNKKGKISDHLSVIFDSDIPEKIERYKGRPGIFKEVYCCKYDMSEIVHYEKLDKPEDIEENEFIFMVNGKIWFYNEPDKIEYKIKKEDRKEENIKYQLTQTKLRKSAFKNIMTKCGLLTYAS